MRIKSPHLHSFLYKTKFLPLIILLWVVTLLAGYIGFLQSGAYDDFFDRSYSTIKLLVGVYPITPVQETPLLNFARFFAIFLTFATILVVIEKLFYEQLRLSWRKFRGGHTIICGMGSVGRRYIQRYLDAEDYQFIVIEFDPSNQKIKKFQEEGVHILIGDATDPMVLVNAGMNKAKTLIAVTGSDTKNAVIATNCIQLRKKNPTGFICSAQISNPLLCNLLQAKLYRNHIGIPAGGEPSNNKKLIESFNIYQLAGMLILEEHPPFKPVYHSSEHPNILVVGGGKFGESIIQRLPHIWKIIPGVKVGKRFTVTLIDRNATKLKQSFR